MRDLNATMFYKAKFQICLDDSQACDLLWKVILNIRHWITKKLNRNGSVIVDNRLFKWTEFKMGSKLYDCQEKNAFFAESAYHKASDTTEKISWSCMIIEKPTPEVGFAQRTWTTEIGYQSTTPNAAEISYVVTYSDATGYIGPCADIPTSSVPNVIKNLMSDPSLRCRIGQHQLSLSPQKLSPGDYPKFEQLIFDPPHDHIQKKIPCKHGIFFILIKLHLICLAVFLRLGYTKLRQTSLFEWVLSTKKHSFSSSFFFRVASRTILSKRQAFFHHAEKGIAKFPLQWQALRSFRERSATKEKQYTRLRSQPSTKSQKAFRMQT